MNIKYPAGIPLWIRDIYIMVAMYIMVAYFLKILNNLPCALIKRINKEILF
jgi:hypothetical protein